MSAKSDFKRQVEAARRTVPGGRFIQDDIRGLSKRAKAMEIDRDEAAAIILARPRHPVTRGIE